MTPHNPILLPRNLSAGSAGLRIDVSGLPEVAWSERSPLWWGNLLFTLIETATVGVLLAAYFYLKLNFQEWPPPKVDVVPPLYHPVPDLGVTTINLALLLATAGIMLIVDRAARRMNASSVRTGLLILVVLGALSCALRYFEFSATKFWWNDNAYASIVWTMLATHLLYILASAGEALVFWLWLLAHPLDEKHALDTTLLAGYWYWMVGVEIVLYAVIVLFPRWT